jgi:hypothetical protein
MNEFDSVVRTQVDALLKLLESSRHSRCSEVRAQAEEQALALRQRARRLARERVSKAAAGERERLDHETRMAQAEIDTELRKRARKRDLDLIKAGGALLAEALAARWRDPAERRAWAEAALAEAASVLLGREWTLEYPADWPADELARAIAYARERCGATVTAARDEVLDKGLRIRSAGALVDMSIPGLLANARTIEGELLAEFNRAGEGETT